MEAGSVKKGGSLVAFTVQRAVEESNDYKSDLYLLARNGRVRRLTAPGDVRDYLWMEDGTLLFTSRGGEEEREIGEGEGTRICCWNEKSGVGPYGVVLPRAHAELLYADETHILFAAWHTLAASHKIQQSIEAAPLESVDVFDEIPFWMNGAGITNRRRRGLYCYDRSNGRTVRLTQDQFDVEQVSIRGGQVLYTGCLNRDRRTGVSEIRLYDLASGTDRQLLDGSGYDFSYAGLWNGTAIMMAVPNSSLSAKTDGDFFRINLESGEVSLFARYGHSCCTPGGTSSDMRLGAVNAVATDGGSLYFVSHRKGDTCLCRLDQDGHIEEGLTGQGSCDSFDVRGGRVIVCGMFGDRICELYENGVQLTHFSDAFYAEHAVSTPEPYSFTDSDGYDIHGWCIKPVNYRPGQSHPAVLQIHGGLRAMYGSVFYHGMQVLAASQDF